MKKIFSVILIVFFCWPMAGLAQNVGINVVSPSEALQVDSTIKIGKSQFIGTATPGRKNQLKFGDGDYVTIGEELIDDKLHVRFGDMVFLKSTGSAGSGYIGLNTETPTANLDVTGSVRLRTGAVAGNVLTSDANGNASWLPGGLVLPYVGDMTTSANAFIIGNTSGSGNAILGHGFGTGTGVTGSSSSGQGVYAYANSGIGLDARSYTGTAGQFNSQNGGLAIKTLAGNVEINGKVKIIDGSQMAGRVLTSDGTGLGSWMNLPARDPIIDISARRFTGSNTIPSGGSPTILTGWDNIEQVGGFGYQYSTGIYTIQATGFYQVNASILWNPMPTNCTTIFSLVLNSGDNLAQNYVPSNSSFGVSSSINCGRRFNAGDKISFRAYQNSGAAVILNHTYDGQNFSIAYIHP